MALAAVQAVVAASEADRPGAVEQLKTALSADSSPATLKAVASELAPHIKSSDKKTAGAREGALLSFAAVCDTVGALSHPYLIPALGDVLVCCADKAKPCQDAAQAAGKALMAKLNTYALKQVLPALTDAMTSDKKWQTTHAALVFVNDLAKTAPVQVAANLHAIVNVVGQCMSDSKAQVKEAATQCLTDACAAIDNRDLEPLIPEVLRAIADMNATEECVHRLGGTTFVQTVDCAALSIVAPLLMRGFREKKTAVKRVCAVIVANMSKLVEEPSEAGPFLPWMIPALAKAEQEISDPEARGVAAKAHAQLKRIEELLKSSESQRSDADGFAQAAAKFGSIDAESSAFVGSLAYTIAMCRCFDESEWSCTVEAYLVPHLGAAKAKEAVAALLKKAVAEFAPKEDEEEVDDAEELCNCKFTLAYGTKILLHNTQMQLKRGFRYGLLGGNDCGKTTLMRAISKEQVEGFPPASELRTVFVEADIQGEMSHLSCLNYIFEDPRIVACNIKREDVRAMLLNVGFTEKMCDDAITTLSGGWRMKLALARAMLQKADILLLDEPTNHLDVKNVAWVKEYLKSLDKVTSIIVSHDSGLLNDVCTHIMQIKDLKLSIMKGNLATFVEKFPEAKSFFELKSSKLKFKFPQPGFIDGVKSKGKPLMRMDDVYFTYPGNEKPTVFDITVRVSLSSRVACVGVNGAGKSTMIKLLLGELEPQGGTVWKHPNAKIAYVAQHAFHHIEQHINKTPNEYIRWRYEFGDDREAIGKVTLKTTEEEEKLMKTPVLVDYLDEKSGETKREKRVVEKLTGNRKEGKGKIFEYEIKWENKSIEHNSYFPADKLEKIGFTKWMRIVDEKVAARASAANRPATKDNVEKHLEDIGLDREFGTHYRMSALSGGQKVKVVLAAAMWMQPHLVVLDEPTNYLDRESLGALADAIREFEGGVVIISHNNQFVDELCPEVWVLEHGKLDCKGDPEWMANAAAEKTTFKKVEELVDAFGNTVKVKEQKKDKLSRKELKAREKLRKARIARGEEVSDDEEW